jgi:mannose-1-phosphate guanylyltransferase
VQIQALRNDLPQTVSEMPDALTPVRVIPVILSGGAGTRLVAAVARDSAEAVDAVAGRRDAAREDSRAALAVPNVADFRDRHQPRVLLPHEGRVRRRARQAAAAQRPILLEPFGRNTAPAVALAALWAQRRHGGDVVLLVLPADHLIRDHAAFVSAVARASSLAQSGALVTFGIAPGASETGFGYIEGGAPIAGNGTPAFKADALRREAAARKSTRVISPPATTFGTRGCSASRRTAVVAAFARYAPGVLEAARAIVHGCTKRRATPRCWRSTPACSRPCPTFRSTMP